MAKKKMSQATEGEVRKVLTDLLTMSTRTALAHELSVTEPNISKWMKSGRIAEEQWLKLVRLKERWDREDIENLASSESGAIEKGGAGKSTAHLNGIVDLDERPELIVKLVVDGKCVSLTKDMIETLARRLMERA